MQEENKFGTVVRVKDDVVQEVKTLQKFYFTFGFNQLHKGYHVIEAYTAEEARDVMVSRYGKSWAFQYSSEEWESVSEEMKNMDEVVWNEDDFVWDMEELWHSEQFLTVDGFIMNLEDVSEHQLSEEVKIFKERYPQADYKILYDMHNFVRREKENDEYSWNIEGELLGNVGRAWNNAGKKPELHEQEKQRLKKHWPTLYKALDEAFTQAGKHL